MKRERHKQRGPAEDHKTPGTRDSKHNRLNKEGRRYLALRRTLKIEEREELRAAGLLNYFRLSS